MDEARRIASPKQRILMQTVPIDADGASNMAKLPDSLGKRRHRDAMTNELSRAARSSVIKKIQG
jgi:hypothetical protein